MTPKSAFRAYLKHFYKPIMQAEPNAGHKALSDLEQVLKADDSNFHRKPLYNFDVVTMNVDGFHQRAGNENVHEVHGTVMTYRCVKNGHAMDIQEALNNYMATKKFRMQKCTECNSTPRPDCVLFGEGLPEDVWSHASSSVSRLRPTDVMLVIGT